MVTALGRAVQEEDHDVMVVLPKYDVLNYEEVRGPAIHHLEPSDCRHDHTKAGSHHVGTISVRWCCDDGQSSRNYSRMRLIQVEICGKLATSGMELARSGSGSVRSRVRFQHLAKPYRACRSKEPRL